MMMMAAAADAVVVRAIGEFNAVQQTHRDQHFHRSIDRRPAQARFILSQRLPEIINGKIGSAFGQRDQPFRDYAPRARIALARLLKGRADFLCYHDSLASFLQCSSIEIVYHIAIPIRNTYSNSCQQESGRLKKVFKFIQIGSHFLC